MVLFDVLPRSKHLARRVTRCATLLKWFVWNERRSDIGAGVPFRRRVVWWRRGFLTSSGILYDFDTYGTHDFLDDISRFELTGLNADESGIATHKAVFRRLVERTHGHALPDLYGIIRRGVVEDADGRPEGAAVPDWLEATVAERGRVVVKPEDGAAGEGVFIVARTGEATATNGEPGIEPVLNAVSDDRAYLVVEYVDQHSYAATIYPDAVNTIRILTLWDEETGVPFIPDAIHRIGTDDSRPVDNWDQGGLSVAVDLETGTLRTATRFPEDTTVDWFETHPDTGTRIRGTRIPRWDDITEDVLELAEHLWYLRMIAWDIVVTDDGYRIIEANSRPTINMHQVHRPLLRDDRTRRFFEHHGVLS